MICQLKNQKEGIAAIQFQIEVEEEVSRGPRLYPTCQIPLI